MEKRTTQNAMGIGKTTVIILSVLLFTFNMSKAQPVMDGAYDPDEGWGEAVASNPDEGFAGSNALNLYVTSDASYVYFGAEVQAADWQSWGFAINVSGEGGIASDVWTYPINYEHNPQPDFVIKGNFGGYAEWRQWDGDSGFGDGTSLGTSDKGISTSFVEVRILRSTLENPTSLNVQFYITGNNESEHATFDAVPQDEVADSWNTSTTLQNYAEDIDVSTEDDPVDPDEFPVIFTVTDETEIYQAIGLKGEMTSWNNAPMVEGPDHTWTLTLEMLPGTYQWGIIENDGSDDGIWLLPEDNLTVSVDEEGNISGQNTYTITEIISDDPEIDWANLQWPPSGSTVPGGEYQVFARVYVNELTGSEATPESLSALQAWIGYSTTNATETSDFVTGWTWVDASLTDYEADFGNDSQYIADIGTNILDEDEYFYVSRFQLGDGAFAYGGFQDGFWDGNENVSGILTVGPPAPNYGIRDDDGENLPTFTYWRTELENDLTQQGSEFQDSNLGEIIDIFIKDAHIETWKSEGGDVNTAYFHYKVWKQDQSEPSEFQIREVGFTSDEGDGNQVWADFGDQIHITQNLGAGFYHLKVKFSIAGEGIPGITENGPFTAEFSIAQLSDAAEIVDFTLEEQTAHAQINSTDATVDVEVVFGTDLNALNPSITLSGGAVSNPQSGTPQDFTQPVIYSVTAEDGVTNREWTVTVTEAPQPEITWANLQWPPSGNIEPESEFMVYAQVFVENMTGADAGGLDQLEAWIGYSNTDASGVEDFDNGWTWIEASLHDHERDFGNNSQYSVDIGTGISQEDEYYYVSRFRLNEGEFAYGGFQDGFWDATDNVSGVLTVQEPQPNYGIRDDDGENLPTFTYWHTELENDLTQQGSEFQDSNLGEIIDLFIKDAHIETWKSEGGDVNAAYFHYKVWQQDQNEPSEFQIREVGFTSDEGDGNQVWADFGDEIPITSNLSAGAYNLKVKFSIAGEGVPGITEDGPFAAEFTISQLSSAAEILAFTFEEQTAPAQINSTDATVDVEVVFGTDLSSLTPSITLSENAVSNPEGGTPQNFTQPVIYTVTAEDGVTNREWTVTVTEAPQPEILWANLQWPPSGNIEPESEFMVYAQVFVENMTGADAGSLDQLEAWIGYGTTDASGAEDFDNGWTWIEASLNDYEPDFGSNSQYATDIGSGITQEGEYFYVSRFRLNEGEFVYGGFQDGFWDGTDNVSGILTVEDEIPTPDTYTITFNLDMSLADFDPDTDVVYITGGMFGWATPGELPDEQTMTRIDDSMTWSIAMDLEPGEYEYKYFLNEGWTGGEWEGDPNRTFTVTDQDIALNDIWGGPPPTYTLTFNVLEPDMSIIDHAVISLNGETNEAGNYVFTELMPAIYSYQISAHGFITQTGQVEIIDQDIDYDVTLSYDEAPLFEVTFTVTDESESYEAIEFKGDMTNWETLPMHQEPQHIWTLTLEVAPDSYQWGVIENDGSEWGQWLLPGDNLMVTIDEEGNISGDTDFSIPPLQVAQWKESVQMYPNPVSTILFMEIPVKAEVHLMNINGLILQKHVSYDGHLRLDMSAFDAGVYFVRIESENHICTKKVIKH